MSKYEWESGTIRIPAAAWPAVKAAVRDAHNAMQAKRLALAKDVHAKILAAGKGKRDADWRAIAAKIIDAMSMRQDADQDALGEIVWRMLPPKRPATGTAGAPLAPLAKDHPLANGATKAFVCGEASIEFDEKTKTLRYRSGDNNHACERARAHPMVAAMFKALSDIKAWTRGSGGEIVGNDEYNRDNESDGGGSNYVKDVFPPPPVPTLPRNYFHAGVGGYRRW